MLSNDWGTTGFSGKTREEKEGGTVIRSHAQEERAGSFKKKETKKKGKEVM